MKKVIVTVAPGTSKETKGLISRGFYSMLGEECEFVSDKSVLGGFVAKYDGKIWDQSLRTQLDTMKRSLESGVEE